MQCSGPFKPPTLLPSVPSSSMQRIRGHESFTNISILLPRLPILCTSSSHSKTCAKLSRPRIIPHAPSASSASTTAALDWDQSTIQAVRLLRLPLTVLGFCHVSIADPTSPCPLPPTDTNSRHIPLAPTLAQPHSLETGWQRTRVGILCRHQ